MHPELFHIGPVTVYSYGLMIATGMIVAMVVSMKRAASRGLSSDHLFNMALLGIISGVLGAKLMYYIVELPAILKDPSILLDLSNGFVVYGGLIGLVTPIFYCKRHQQSFLKYIDVAIPTVALAQGFGRIGCFLAGCCYGVPTNAWYGVVFPEGSLAPAGVALIPSQLISSGLDFLHAIILFLYTSKKWDDRRPSGTGLGLYAILYSIGRFFVEYLRSDPRGNVGIFSTSQGISLGIVVIGILWMVFLYQRQKKQKEAEKSSLSEKTNLPE